MIEWEPIETAPRDDTHLLLWLPPPLSKPAIGYWDRRSFAGLSRTATLRPMNLCHRTGRLSRRRLAPRTGLFLCCLAASTRRHATSLNIRMPLFPTAGRTRLCGDLKGRFDR